MQELLYGLTSHQTLTWHSMSCPETFQHMIGGAVNPSTDPTQPPSSLPEEWHSAAITSAVDVLSLPFAIDLVLKNRFTWSLYKEVCVQPLFMLHLAAEIILLIRSYSKLVSKAHANVIWYIAITEILISSHFCDLPEWEAALWEAWNPICLVQKNKSQDILHC